MEGRQGEQPHLEGLRPESVHVELRSSPEQRQLGPVGTEAARLAAVQLHDALLQPRAGGPHQRVVGHVAVGPLLRRVVARFHCSRGGAAAHKPAATLYVTWLQKLMEIRDISQTTS